MSQEVEEINNRFNRLSIDQMYDGLHDLFYNNFGVKDLNSHSSILLKQIELIYLSKLPGTSQCGYYLTETAKLPSNLLYRAVRHKTRPEFISETSYRQNVDLKTSRLGRCHFADQQVFYGSNGKNTALHEIEIRENEKAVIGLWEIERNNVLLQYLYGGEFHNKLFKTYLDPYINDLRNKYSGLEFTKRMHLMKITTAMVLSNNYLLSSYISNVFFNQPEYTSNVMLVYPSVIFMDGQYNTALTKSAVDNQKIKPIKFIYGEVLKIDFNFNIKLNIESEGVPNSDTKKIDWDN